MRSLLAADVYGAIGQVGRGLFEQPTIESKATHGSNQCFDVWAAIIPLALLSWWPEAIL